MMNEYTDIIRGLLRKTESRRLNWTPTEIKNQFIAPLGEGTVQMDFFDIEDQMTDPDSTIYRVDFLNNKGESVANTLVSDRTDSNFDLLDKLWKEVTDSYYRRTETLSSMREALGL